MCYIKITMTQQNCKMCNKEFVIRDEDMVFYEQVKVPIPQNCSDCRMMRRMAFRNERTLYKRECDLCKEKVISIYTENTPFPVYCHKCWWSDEWDPKSYGVDYDPNIPFIKQTENLLNAVPRVALLTVNSVRSEYTNSAGDNKDCYLIFAADGNEDCMYSRLIMKSKMVSDCAFTYDSELCYECIDARSCFKCMYSEQCQSSSDLLFCYNMRDSSNCILCTNGRHMSNSILNVKYSKEEFEEKKTEILASYENIEKAKLEYEKIKNEAIVKYAVQTKCNNVTGDYMFNCYDGINLFDVSNAKNCSYIADSEEPIDCQDCNNVYYKPELCYELMGSLSCSKTKFSKYVFYCNEVEYCDSCYNLTSALGSVAIRKGEYMILNKQYDKETFTKLKKEIVDSMIKGGSYGEFFSQETSPFGYNEALSIDFFPLTQEVASKLGFKWQEKNTGTFGKETMPENTIPSSITTVTDAITSEILACNECGKNYKITRAEFDFYKRMNLPIPHKDFECRHQARMAKRNPRKLYPGKCMCEIENHLNHTGTKCGENFETSYSPERKEIVYCESCYNQEIA